MQVADSPPRAPTAAPPTPAAPASLAHLARAAAVLLALGLALLAQLYLSGRVAVLDGVLFYAVAVFVFLKLLAPQPLLQAGIARPSPTPLTPRWPITGYLALLLASLTFLTAGGNTVRPITLAYWTGAIALALYAAAEPRPDPRAAWQAACAWLRLPPRALQLRVSGLALLVLAVVLLGAFYRFYQLDAIPSDMTSDHAEKLYDVQDLVEGQRPWFFPRNTGREPLQFYLTLPIAATRGADFLSLKLVTAFVGTLGVLWCFLFARQFFDDAVGLVAAFLMAVGQWDVEIARVGLRFPFGASFAALCLYLLFRVLRHGQRRDYLLLGLGLGIGLYGYTPFRLVVPLFVALALTLALRWRDGLPARLDLLRNALLCAAVTGVVFLPLARYMADAPASFWERSLSRVAAPGASVAGPVPVFLENLKNAALMFHWQGDAVWVNHVPHAPTLDPFTGALFLLGVAYAIARLVCAREWVYAYLLLALPVLTLSSTAALGWPGENPSVARAGPVVAVVYLLAALPLVLTARHLCTLLGRGAGRVLAAGLVATALALAAYWNFQSYFVAYAEQYRRAAINTGEMGQVVRGFAQSIGSYADAYHVAWPHWADTRNIGIAAGNPRWSNALLTADAVRAAAMDRTRGQLYLLHPDDRTSLALLREMRPEGRAEVYRSRTPGREFVIYFAPGPAG